KRPEQRLSSAEALAHDLRRVAGGRRPLARPPQEGGLDRRSVLRFLPALLGLASIAVLVALASRQPPTPLEWAQGLVQPNRMFRRVMEMCDSATVRIHYNTRTLPRLREAREQTEHALTLLHTLRLQPYHDEVRAHLRFRLGEARYLIAERTYDSAEYEAAAETWLGARELPQPPRRVPIPDTLGISTHGVILPMGTQPWAAAAMALDDRARLDQSDRSLARALQIRREGAQLFANSVGAKSLLEVPLPASMGIRNMYGSWLQGVGTSLVMDGANRSDARAVREGLGYVRSSALLFDSELESSAQAARVHDLGIAFMWAGLFEQADSLVDSAAVRLRYARKLRMEIPGYTSFVYSSRALARTLRLKAWRSRDRATKHGLFVDALAQLSLPPESEVRLGPLDVALLAMAAAEVLVDLGCVERDSSRFTQAMVQLDRASQLLPPRQAPSLNTWATLQRLRIEGQRFAITGSSVHLVRSMQAIDQGNWIQGEFISPRWTHLVSAAADALKRQSARAFALDYPVPTPF
ncbi:MAG: hypothetical protein ABIU54_11695, partial [Candidatus Eisenbacteria bacterium]